MLSWTCEGRFVLADDETWKRMGVPVATPSDVHGIRDSISRPLSDPPVALSRSATRATPPGTSYPSARPAASAIGSPAPETATYRQRSTSVRPLDPDHDTPRIGSPVDMRRSSLTSR